MKKAATTGDLFLYACFLVFACFFFAAIFFSSIRFFQSSDDVIKEVPSLNTHKWISAVFLGLRAGFTYSILKQCKIRLATRRGSSSFLKPSSTRCSYRHNKGKMTSAGTLSSLKSFLRRFCIFRRLSYVPLFSYETLLFPLSSLIRISLISPPFALSSFHSPRPRCRRVGHWIIRPFF